MVDRTEDSEGGQREGEPQQPKAGGGGRLLLIMVMLWLPQMLISPFLSRNKIPFLTTRILL